ncbi:MAG: iron-sulfur cluster repair di-iron protein [Pyrinomonadaceae bacterium]
MNFNTTTTVRDLAVEIPGATRVFEKLKIDYCCGGGQTLAAACATAHISTDEVERLLEQASTAPNQAQGSETFDTAKLSLLIEHIVNLHHFFTKQEVDRLDALAEKVFLAHGANHPELASVKQLVNDLGNDLRPHMMKEERVLFPYIVNLEESATQHLPATAPPFGTVQNPVRMMMAEHDAVGDLLVKLREVTNNYTVPADGCFSYQTLYHALVALEEDLHQHIHLENNILFPRAVAMETKAFAE